MIRWLLTEWCNYNCAYCGQEHGRFAPAGNGLTAHAFDNFPVEQWQSAFAHHFKRKRLSVTISGGEPMLDRKGIIQILNFLARRKGTECIRIDTNASWDPRAFRDLDRSKIILNCSFHPTQADTETYVSKLGRILDAGFQIGMVNYVMAETQFDAYVNVRPRFEALGVPLNPNPDFARTREYDQQQCTLLRSNLPDIDYRFKVLRERPLGRSCLYPAVTYEIDFRGLVNVGCFKAKMGSFFDPELPELFAGPAPCPHEGCACLDMYPFLEGSARSATTNPLRAYADELSEIRRREAELSNHCGA